MRGGKFMSQINTNRAQVLGFKPTCFAHGIEKGKVEERMETDRKTYVSE
jgi:hypothetical protein